MSPPAPNLGLDGLILSLPTRSRRNGTFGEEKGNCRHLSDPDPPRTPSPTRSVPRVPDQKRGDGTNPSRPPNRDKHGDVPEGPSLPWGPLVPKGPGSHSKPLGTLHSPDLAWMVFSCGEGHVRTLTSLDVRRRDPSHPRGVRRLSVPGVVGSSGPPNPTGGGTRTSRGPGPDQYHVQGKSGSIPPTWGTGSSP